MGFGFRLNTYSDSGNARYRSSQSDPLVLDPEGDITLSIQQYELTGNLIFSPMRSQFISFGFWAGMGSLNFSETRTTESTSVSVTDDESQKFFTNEGSRTLLTSGSALYIDITPLEESSVYSMIANLGIDRVYMAPYLTLARDTDNKGADFTTQAYGLMFGFEAAK